MQRRLDAVLAGVRGGPTYRVVGDASVTITDVTIDSREVVPGALFCCLPGAHHDGHEFAAASVAAGAAAILVERELPLAVPQVVTSAARALTGWVAAAFHDHPCDALQMVGVTGTNGKTTTSQLIGDVLRHAGRQVEVLGTLSGKHTTPEAPALQRQLAAWRDGGVDVVVMEVSSHALVMDRVAGTRFDVAVFTNLGRDHLDLHGTVERYFAAKARLFEATLSDLGIVNVDDVHGRLLLDSMSIATLPYSLDDVSDLRVEATWHEFTWRGVDVRVGIGGRYNASNSLAAAEACAALGLSPATIAAGLRAARPVPGRFEPVDAGQPFAVIVDYAHTPDGLAVALAAARDAAGGHRVLVVFGCGGDRDREKRPEMGSVAAAGADVVVVTSDNPRSEDPAAIIDAIIRGVPADYRGRVVIEADRSLAIATAIHHAQPGDVVLIAGKGHETTQTIGTTVLPFDDRAVARTLLEARS
jgi:UDP-N-acetylmuramoyl-L-alanyl-D-glutamate--2,6-diaminopimelate ligase